MGFLDRLLGREEPAQPYRPAPQAQRSDDEIAVERYQYLLRTAPPETIEQVHQEAFTKLTDEQRDLLFQKLSESAAESERPRDASPAALATAATRTEIQRPGTLTRAFGGQQGAQQNGPSFGSMVGSSLLGTVAGYVIGSALVSAFMPDFGGADASTEAGAEGDTGGEAGADTSSADGGWDSGGDFGGDAGGDFGDFGF